MAGSNVQAIGGASFAPLDPQTAFERWLNGAFEKKSSPTLVDGARLFSAAAADSTYTQAKVALVQVLAHLRERRPELVEPFFEAVEPWLRGRVAELSEQERPKELRQLDDRSLEVPVSIPIPQDVLEEIAATQRDAALALYEAMTATDLAQEKAWRSQVGRQRVGVQSGQTNLPPKVAKARSVERVANSPVSDAQWGAFMGRLVSHATTPADDQALGRLAKKGRFDKTLVEAMKISGVLDDLPDGLAWMKRVSAGIQLAERCRFGSPIDSNDKVALAVLVQSDITPTMEYSPLRSLRDGDLESLLLRWISTSAPGLAGAMVDNHPHIPKPSQLQALSAQMDEIAREQGRFLEGYNVLTIMHQMGRSVPWLTLLHEKLGLEKQDYLGVSVPYSGSKIAEARLNRERFETLADHDPRPELLGRLQDTLGGGNPSGFDELKEEDIRRAVGRMLEKHRANGKPIMIVDDGGYAAKVIRKYFKDDEDKFKIVEWTTRGVRLFEEIEDPKLALVSAAESGPKVEIEPAFIADSVVEHFKVALRARFPDLKDKRILVVGAGNIGRACALAAHELGAVVTMNDKRADRLAAAVAGTEITAEPDLKKAVRGQHAIVPVTGANSLPDEIFGLMDPGTVVAPASSVDIETRSEAQFANGHWSTDLSRLTVVIGPDLVPSRSPFKNAITERGASTLEAGLTREAANHGLDAMIERRDIVAGGFVLNLSRRVRVMPIQREELILLNVTEAIAQAAQTSAPGKHLMKPKGEDRITRLFGQYHPEELAFAQRFAASS